MIIFKYIPAAGLLWVFFAASACKTVNVLEYRSAEKYSMLDSAFYLQPDYEYRIRKDDKISISVWGQDELSVGSLYGIYNSNEVYGKWLMVDARGTINVPKIGPFPAEGATISGLRDSLRTRFGQWVKNPVLDVKVLNREITVLGEVRDPQVILLDKEKNTLLEAIARCKGFEFYANLKKVKVLRQVGTDVHIATIDLTQSNDFQNRDIRLIPGDVVIVPSKKYKEFDRRVSVIIPFTTTITAAAIFKGAL